MNKIVSDRLFGLTLSIVTYKIGVWLNQKFKSPILKVCYISYDSYNVGVSIIILFLASATKVLAYSIYLQLKVLKKFGSRFCLAVLPAASFLLEAPLDYVSYLV